MNWFRNDKDISLIQKFRNFLILKICLFVCNEFEKEALILILCKRIKGQTFWLILIFTHSNGISPLSVLCLSLKNIFHFLLFLNMILERFEPLFRSTRASLNTSFSLLVRWPPWTLLAYPLTPWNPAQKADPLIPLNPVGPPLDPLGTGRPTLDPLKPRRPSSWPTATGHISQTSLAQFDLVAPLQHLCWQEGVGQKYFHFFKIEFYLELSTICATFGMLHMISRLF